MKLRRHGGGGMSFNLGVSTLQLVNREQRTENEE